MAIAIEHFGRDHWSTLAYAESCAVNCNGVLDHTKMRCDGARHPQMNHLSADADAIEEKQATRLRNGALLDDHDDWDCLDDLEAAGWLRIVRIRSYVRVEMSDAGWRASAALRRHLSMHRAKSHAYSTFDVSAISEQV